MICLSNCSHDADVSFHYPAQPEERGLKHISVTIKAGQTLAVVGATGSGKTTLSRLLFRFYDPLSGAVLLNDHDISQYSLKSVRELIGVVPQDTVLFNDTVLYNIKYGRMDATMEEIEKVAEAAQIREFIESLPDKWDTRVRQRPAACRYSIIMRHYL
jgi:ABC-type multidrug transport system fused ATPase/permease subunit